jgi:aspartyl-tRNA(Asn)/glutamyl-tRNA(Gln) amidotransferase subunit A
MAELHALSAHGLVAGFKAGDFSPVDATRAVLSRIDELNPRLNAFCLVDAESALAAAKDSEARWSKGSPAGPLDGVPISIKDLLLTKGWPTLYGSRTTNPDQAWDEDAPLVARLRESGAVLLGKTTTPEFGHKGVTDSALHGITRNPWNPDLTPGGSSGGAGAAVATGMGPLAIGTDGGGTVRLPANFCGLVGLKATAHRMPMWPPSRRPGCAIGASDGLALDIARTWLLLRMQIRLP